MVRCILVGVAIGLILVPVQIFSWQQANPSSRSYHSSEVQGPRNPADRNQSPVLAPDYVIGPADILDIDVFKEPDLSLRVPVRPDGKISLPLLNDVQAAGLTPTQLADSIQHLLRKYVTQPQVTVIVIDINSKRVYLIGEVNRPGAIPMLPQMTVLQALASAGGFTDFANLKKIYILRGEAGKQHRLFFNYKEAIRGDMRQNVVLKPGDTIVVP